MHAFSPWKSLIEALFKIISVYCDPTLPKVIYDQSLAIENGDGKKKNFESNENIFLKIYFLSILQFLEKSVFEQQ